MSGRNPPYEAFSGWWVILPWRLGSSLSTLALRVAQGCDRWFGKLRRTRRHETVDKRHLQAVGDQQIGPGSHDSLHLLRGGQHSAGKGA